MVPVLSGPDGSDKLVLAPAARGSAGSVGAPWARHLRSTAQVEGPGFSWRMTQQGLWLRAWGLGESRFQGFGLGSSGAAEKSKVLGWWLLTCSELSFSQGIVWSCLKLSTQLYCRWMHGAGGGSGNQDNLLFVEALWEEL